MASSTKFARNGAVGFIDWLDGFIDMQAHVLNAFATAVSNDNIRSISDWPDHCHPQGYTEAKDDVIEQAYTSQVSITRRSPSQPAHPL